MDSWCKALLTMGLMLLVTTAARWLGRRAAGALAALPTVTAPTLAWTAAEQGPDFAVDSAVGSVAACAVLAMFALAYVHASRRLGALPALACALLAAAATWWPARQASDDLGSALLLALAFAGLALGALPQRLAVPAGLRPAQRSPLALAAVVGGLALLAAKLGPLLGSFATGLLASLPLVSGAQAISEHRSGGHGAATEFLRAYLWGLFGKAGFGALFACLVEPAGVLPALLLAAAFACVLGWPRRPLHFSAG